MSGNSSKSKGKVQYYGGQEAQAARLFDAGGIFDQVLGGGLTQQDQRLQQSGLETLGREFASRGLTGSGLEGRALVDTITQTNQAASENQFNRLLALISPAGQQTAARSSGGGVL